MKYNPEIWKVISIKRRAIIYGVEFTIEHPPSVNMKYAAIGFNGNLYGFIDKPALHSEIFCWEPSGFYIATVDLDTFWKNSIVEIEWLDEFEHPSGLKLTDEEKEKVKKLMAISANT